MSTELVVLPPFHPVPREGGAGADELGLAIVASYLASLQSERSRSTTRESLRRVAKALGIEDYGQIPWARLGYDELQVIRQRLAEVFAPATANTTLSAVRGVLRVGYLTHRITLEQWTAAQNTRKIKGTRLPHGRALSEEEIGKLFTACAAGGRPRGTMLQALIATMCGLGLRREEAGALTIDQVAGDEVRIVGKGNRERVGYLDAPTRRRLESWLTERKTLKIPHRFLFFVIRTRNPMGHESIWHILRKLGKDAGLARFSPHDLRRTFASRLLDAGLDLSEVQRLMGHADVSTTVRYDKRAELSLANRRRAVRVFDE